MFNSENSEVPKKGAFNQSLSNEKSITSSLKYPYTHTYICIHTHARTHTVESLEKV